MTNHMNLLINKTRTFQGIPVNVVLYATGGPPTITFPCKDMRSINDVRLTCDNGYVAVPIARVHNVVQFRLYKTMLSYGAPSGAAVTIGNAGNNVLEGVAGPFTADTTTAQPVEVPDGVMNVNIYGLGIGVR